MWELFIYLLASKNAKYLKRMYTKPIEFNTYYPKHNNIIKPCDVQIYLKNIKPIKIKNYNHTYQNNSNEVIE